MELFKTLVCNFIYFIDIQNGDMPICLFIRHL